jgi:hypothetical protein
VTSCTFSPDEKFFNDLKVTTPSYSISLNGYNNLDTIRIYSNKQFEYNIVASTGKIEKVNILIDNKVVTTLNTSVGKFELFYPYLKTGTFELKVEFQSPSGTGSLAERVGAEKYVEWRKWTLVIDVDPPKKPNIEFTNSNGFLTLNWEKYSKPNFLRYTLERREGSNSKYIVIKDPKKNTWVDSTFVGGYRNSIEYSLGVETSLGSSGSVWSDRFYKNFNLNAKISFSQLDSIATIDFTPCPYYGALKEYVLVENSTINIRWTDNDVSTITSKLSTIVFNKLTKVGLRLVPKYSIPPASFFYSEDTDSKLFLGTKIDAVFGGNSFEKRFSYNATMDKYLSFFDQKIYIHNSDFSFHSVKNLGPGFIINYLPYYGSYGYFTDEINRKTVCFDIVNDQYFRWNFYSYNSSITGSSEGIVNYSNSIKSFNIWIYSAGLQDVVNTRQVFALSKQYAIGVTLSDDGKYFFARDGAQQLYRIVNKQPELIGPFNEEGFLLFRRDDSSEFFTINSTAKEVKVFDSNTLQLKRTFKLPITNYAYSYDPKSFSLFFYASNYVINLSTGKYRWVKLENFDTSSFSFTNGCLINGVGYYVKII